MRLDAAFRLSTYLTLTIASLCLGYAEEVFLPGMIFFGVFMALILAAAFAAEGRWRLRTSGQYSRTLDNGRGFPLVCLPFLEIARSTG